jgi:apolipoprotein N-acyltransferase
MTWPTPLAVDGPTITAGARRVARAWAATGAAVASALLAGGLFAASCPPNGWSLAAWAVPGLLLVGARGVTLPVAFACGVTYAVAIGSLITSWAPAAAIDYFALSPLVARAFILGVHAVNPGIPCGLLVVAYVAASRVLRIEQRALAGAALWVASEWLRTWSLGWELLAHSQYRTLDLIQVADLGGAYALSFVMACSSIAVAELARAGWRQGLAPRRAAAVLALPVALLLATLAYGAVALARYGSPPAAPAAGDGQRIVGVVQGNVPNSFRWRRAFFGRVLGTYAELSAGIAGARPDLIVWPENAVSFYVNQESLLRAQIAALAAPAREGLLIGAPRRGDGPWAYNSAYLFHQDGALAGIYDKRVLLPFGEYDPLAPAPDPSAADEIRYAAGDSAEPLRAGGLELGVMICFEVLYPGLARELVRHGAQLLVNLSNDAWMDSGDGAAPAQHLSMAIFRAVETRRYLVRAASSGASAFVAPTGAIASALPNAFAGTLVGRVELRQGESVYVRWGDAWIAAALLVLGIDLARERRRRRAARPAAQAKGGV